LTTAKGPGRPRDQAVEQKVVDATFDLLNENGFAGLSIEAISVRASVSKAAIYRRWDSKDELLVDAMASVIETVEIGETGDIRSDLVAALRSMQLFITDTRAGEVFPWLVGEIAARSEVGLRYGAAISRRRELLFGLVERAVLRGDLRADLDVQTALDMLSGAMILRKITGLGFPDNGPEHLVDTLLEGWVSGKNTVP
jgi:AcrR family transcriptional regulator